MNSHYSPVEPSQAVEAFQVVEAFLVVVGLSQPAVGAYQSVLDTSHTGHSSFDAAVVVAAS